MQQLGHLRRASRLLMTGRSPVRGVIDFPVYLAVVSEDLGYFAVFADTRAVSTLAEDEHVRFAFCNFRARPGGSDQPGRAESISGSDISAAKSALAGKWPWWFRGYLIAERVRGRSLAYYRVVPTEEPTPWAVGLR